MFVTKLVGGAALVLVGGVLVMGAGLTVQQAFPTQSQGERSERVVHFVNQDATPPKPDPQRTDLYGDPLPEGAVARMGTVRLRHAGSRFGFLSFSSDGNTLISGDDEGIIRTWDIKTGKQLRQFNTILDQPSDTAISLDQRLLAVGNISNKFGLWDLASGKALRSIELPQPMPLGRLCLAFTPDGKVLACAAGKDAEITYWDTTTGKLLSSLQPQPKLSYVSRLAFTADGAILLAKTNDGVVHFLDPASGRESRQFRTPGNLTLNYAFSPDGRTFAFGQDSSVVLWDISNGKELARLGGQNSITIEGVAFSPDGKILAVAGHFSVHLWDVANQMELHKIEGLRLRSARSLCFSPDGKTLAAAGDDAAIRLWNVATGQELQHREGHTNYVYQTAFSPDGKLLATMDVHDTMRLWESDSGKLVQTISASWPMNFQYMLFTPDGKTVIAADGGGSIRSYETVNGKQLWGVTVSKETDKGGPESPDFNIQGLAFSSDSSQLIALVRRTVRDPQGPQTVSTVTFAWDRVTGKRIFEHDQPEKNAAALWALSPDGRLRASYNHGPVSNLHDVRTGKHLLAIQAKGGGVWPVAFSPDGRYLAGVCHYGRGLAMTVALWELATGNEIHNFSTELIGLRTSLAFSADGSILAAGGDDNAGLQLWDLTTGKELSRYQGAGASILSLTFDRDTPKMASGLRNGTALIWDAKLALQRREKGTVLAADDLERLWPEMSKEESTIGQRALWNFAIRPNQTLPFLKERLRPAEEVDLKRIQLLLTDMNSDEFEVREAATNALERMDQQAEPLMRKALDGKLSPEVQRRLETVLDRPRIARSAETLRRLRSIHVLEYIGSADAQDLLKYLASGASDAWETQEAKASLERLSRRPEVP